MASVTALEWEASSCQVGGSLGLMARPLAEVRRLLEDLITLRPACGKGNGGRERGQSESKAVRKLHHIK